MLGPHVLVAQSLGFLSREIQNAFAFLAEWNFYRGRDPFANGNARLDFLADRFDRAVRAQETVGERLILAQQPQQQMLRLDVRAAVLASLVPGEKNHAPSFFCIAFKHGSPTLSRSLQSSARRPRERNRRTREPFCARSQLAMFQTQNAVGPAGD